MAKSSKSRNRIRGKLAQSVGAQWESMIENEVARLGNLILVKQYPETQFIQAGRARVVGTAWADYICMGREAGGNTVFTFDAKTTKNKQKLKMPQKRMHQFAKLKLAASVGIPAFYLVWWRSSNIIAAHYVTNESRWPFYAIKDENNFSTDLSPGWAEPLIRKISDKCKQ